MQSPSVNKDFPESTMNNIEMAHKSEIVCTAVDSVTGNICGEKTGLQILNEFREFYEGRIRRIDTNSDNVEQEKMKIMMEWVKDLDAQNTMLVCTVEELEEAACDRVKMLEEKLKHTSSALADHMPQYTKPSETILNNFHDRISELEMDEVTLKQKVVNLQSDIRGLLELIRRANTENCWSLDGIKFLEISEGDIPLSDESNYGQAMGDYKSFDIMTQQLQLLNEKEKKSIKYQHELQEKVTYLNEKLQDREETIQKLMSKFEDLKDSFKRRTEANADIKYDIIHLLDMEKSDLVTVENSSDDIHEEIVNKDGVQACQRYENKLEDKTREIMRLKHQLNKLEKESLESRDALAIEVAGKHDTVMNLKQQVNKLEENGRQLQMQLHFKEDIIKNMRTEMKLLKTKMGTVSLKSPKKSHINASPTSQRVTWSDSISNETLGEIKTKNNSVLTTLLELKTILISEHGVLKEKIQELHNILYHTTLMEKATYDKYLVAGHSMVDDMLAMMEKYRDRVIENNDKESSTTNAAFNCNDKLMKVIDALSDLCMNKNKRILDLEYIIESTREKNEQINDLSECKENIRDNPEITRQQFNEMEEFRVCTVEAQAATEDLREEIDGVMCNLNCRNKLFNDLCDSIEKIRDIIARTKQNISSVINSIKAHIEEKILGNNTIKLGHDKLKDMKNEINEARSKFHSSKDDCREYESDIYNRSFDNIMDEVEYIVCNLDVFLNKEDYSITLLEELRDHVNSVEENLEEMQRDADRVLQENEMAQKVIDEKTKKLDKLEQQLDYAHTKMQETLENIVFINQQNESSNGNSCSVTDDVSLIINNDEHSQLSAVEIDQLKNSLYSKDKLLEHKDEVIRIQKDSIEMTQGEYKDLRQRLQSKIDAQVDVINHCMQEKMKLLEQNQLQNQTIKHLQDAVVDAKKNLNRQLPQKSTMDFGIGDGWSPITTSVLNNGNVHDGFIIADERDIDHQVKHILIENHELKQRLMAYREDLYTVMNTTKSKTPIKKHHKCKIHLYLRAMNKLKNKSKEYEKLLQEYSERLQTVQTLLKKKSDELVILKTNYQTININELQNELCNAEDNYRRVCSDFEKSQKQLLEAATREFELQHLLNEALENSSKDMTIDKLNNLTDNLNLELEYTRAELNKKEFALAQTQDIHKANVDQIKYLIRQIKSLEERNIELSEINEYLMQQTNNHEKETPKMISKKSSKQLLILSQKKIHGDGVDESLCRVSSKTISRYNRHHSIRPYTSNIILSTCCSIGTITTTTRTSMSDNSL